MVSRLTSRTASASGVIQGPDAVFAKRAWLGLRWRQPRVSALQVQPCSLRTHHRALGRRPSAVVAAAARGLVGVGCGAALAGDTSPTGHTGWAYGGVGTTAGRDEIPARAGWLVRRREREIVRERRGHGRRGHVHLINGVPCSSACECPFYLLGVPEADQFR